MPTPKPPRKKFRPKARTYVLDELLGGSLKGAHVIMGSMTGREMIKMRSGEMTEGEAMEFTASKVIEHNIEIEGGSEDIRDLDAEDFLVLAETWTRAMKDAAIPPGQGDR